jgi:hypothetical protein
VVVCFFGLAEKKLDLHFAEVASTLFSCGQQQTSL